MNFAESASQLFCVNGCSRTLLSSFKVRSCPAQSRGNTSNSGGGEATYRARSMLALIIDTFYIDEDLCATSSKTEFERQTNKPTHDTIQKRLTVAMYPNPAKDFVYLKLSENVKEPLRLWVADALGKVVINMDVLFTGGIYSLNTSVMSSGMYYVSLNNNGSHLFGQKLCIFRQ
jgi:hypothetical protein